ncbi:ATP-dependent translocase ABCB1 [Trichonephila clavata]|uniref:ABC-type xenobiotic transporter n=1 Tax=Trichonephila clavata TaxID=2740835 RepID=A0A8X6KVK6_TRICU|nr:ATP-dependent translocase ABCB1 [Trichonephila clavata]
MGVRSEERNLIQHAPNSTKEYGSISKKDSEHYRKRTRHKSSKNLEKEKSKLSIWQLFRYSKKFDVFLMLLGSFFAIVNGAGWPILAIVFGSMTNTFLMQSTNQVPLSYDNASIFMSQDLNQLSVTTGNITANNFEEYMTTFSLYYVFIGIAVFIASIIQILSWLMACERQVYILRQEFFYQVLRHEISWFDKHQSGELTTRLNDDLERIREGIGDKFSMIIQYGSTFLAGFVVGFAKGWQLTLVIMSMTPLLTLSSAFMGKMVSTSSSREQKKYAVAGGIAEEVLGNIRTVTMFNGQEREVKRYKSALIQGMDIALRKYVYVAFAFGFTFLILYGSYALAFWYGSELVFANKMTPGDVFSVFFAVMIGSFSLGNAMPQLTAVATAKGSAKTIFDIINKVPKIDPYSRDGIQPKDFSANIAFHNVNFSYPTRKTVEVLKHFSLQIREGQRVALCGPSGSGKSTIVNLIQRFYDPVKGYVTLGDYDLKTLNVHWLRSKIGIVSQEPVLFSGSIAKNIEYGYENVTFPDVVAAAKMANAHDFIIKLPQGYDTLVGERGAQLSGGQKQRIAIARALVRDPKILLLDEATSALDSESEAVVQEALDKAQEGRTTIVVAHRLSTIKTADVICAMENGEIKEQGSHEELMAKKSLYYQLVTNQVFVDEGVNCSSEEARRSDDDVIRNLKRKRSSIKTAIHINHRQISNLEVDLKEENVEVPSGFRILKESKKEWKEIVIGSLASVVTGVVMPTYAVFYSEIFNTFSLTGTAMKNSAFFWSMMFLVLAGVTCLGHIFRTIGYAFAGERLTMRLRNQSFTNIIRQDISWFDDYRHSTGKISSRLATDIPLVKSAAGVRIGTVISAAVTLAASIAIAFIFGWKLALALILVVPILLVAGAVQMKTLKGNQKRDAELMSDASEVACEAIENIKTVQGLTLEERFYERYVSNLFKPFMENKKNAKVYALAYAFSQAIMFFTYAAAFRLGAYLVARNEMETVDVYRVFFAMAFSAVSVGQWTSYLPDYAKAKLSAGLVFHLINIVPNIDSSSKGGIRPDVKGKIDFIDVHFRYPSRKNVLVLQGINLTIHPGQTVALVGSSGCGKSTLIALLERFYDPESGQILLDGFDIKTMNLKHLRNLMALVSQEPVLFNCSIKENIVYGIEEKVSDSDIEKAAITANIHDFIVHLPEKYETVVGERGTQLSGGQKQRIAIARALVRQPKILLLDEATSALDTESEKAVQDALDQARQGRTCIIIAHRLSTVQGADCIAVIENGKIVEKGTHQELINKKGIYYKLIKRQYT